MKTLIKPWKGLKLFEGISIGDRLNGVKTLIKPWKGLKLLRHARRTLQNSSENPNKTLEGIKTEHIGLEAYIKGISENPNKTLEGIKTSKLEMSLFPAVTE
ncbi:hypothetical protein U27_01438 [Candidatus Vecturithrix granuli]|uniref:Uncharacterized protein n=1 Tax=Vecturithrix granuli TaxID=1499967 RepID=A0A081CAD2_VECG1|nr:hypothetical protein U27_01438 [Candidatus Vecturithrix granuli]